MCVLSVIHYLFSLAVSWTPPRRLKAPETEKTPYSQARDDVGKNYNHGHGSLCMEPYLYLVLERDSNNQVSDYPVRIKPRWFQTGRDPKFGESAFWCYRSLPMVSPRQVQELTYRNVHLRLCSPMV